MLLKIRTSASEDLLSPLVRKMSALDKPPWLQKSLTDRTLRTALNISVLVCFYDFWLPVANEMPLQVFASFDNFMAPNPRKELGSTLHTHLGCMQTLGSHQLILQ